MIPVGAIILAIRLIAESRSSSGVNGGLNLQLPGTWRTASWVGTLLGWFTVASCLVIVPVAHFGGPDPHLRRDLAKVANVGSIASITSGMLVGVAGIAFSFFAWPILRHLARRGRHVLVYRLAHVAFIFPSTGETYAGASLLAGIALAHRGSTTKDERDWLWKRIAKEQRYLGTYAAATALHQALEARAARDEGRRADAETFAERARSLFGTITYLSRSGVPAGVRSFAYEYLALDDARRGRWGGVMAAPEQGLSPVNRALRGWFSEHLMRQPKSAKTERLRQKLGSAALDALYARPHELTLPEKAGDAWLEARKVYLALLRGEAVGVRAPMMMLAIFDVLLDPRCPDTVLPEDLRSNEELVASLHDEIAAAISVPLTYACIPLHAKDNYGPISARVYQLVETALFDELSRATAALEERSKLRGRRDPFGEWLEVSYARGIYRRVELALGFAAVAEIWPQFAFAYCNLGVQLSEQFPRMRPLAHAVFKVLSGEAIRFHDHRNAQQQWHNMSVTSGVE